jgi:hypothetical protein
VSEVREEVKTVMVDMTCDECAKGMMRHTGITLTSYPPKYPHVCNNCGAQATYWKSYPYVTHERVGATPIPEGED